MPLPSNSPLRNLPQGLPTQLQLCLDGIRYSIDIADLAYGRLHDALLAISKEDPPPEGERLTRYLTSIFADAWQLVDSVNRLRDLVNNLPGVKKSKAKSPYLHEFLEKTQPIDALRNQIQHLETELPSMAEKKQPTWGTLAWSYQEKDGEGRVYTALAGSFPADAAIEQSAFPFGRKVPAPFAYILLNCAGIKADLQLTIQAVNLIARALAASYETLFRGQPIDGADYLVVFRWGPKPPNG